MERRQGEPLLTRAHDRCSRETIFFTVSYNEGANKTFVLRGHGVVYVIAKVACPTMTSAKTVLGFDGNLLSVSHESEMQDIFVNGNLPYFSRRET